MRTSSLFATAYALSVLCAACSSATDGTTDESDITKRTKPKAGMSAIVLEKPTWLDTALFKGEVVAQNGDKRTALPPNAQTEFVPGDYRVYFRPEGMSEGFQSSASGSWSTIGHLWRKSGSLAVGDVWSVNPAGLRVELDRPLVWRRAVPLATLAVPDPAVVHVVNGYSSVRTQKDAMLESVAFNSLTMTAEQIASSATSVNRLFPAETYELTLGGSKTPVTLREGKLETVSVKTLSFAVDLDPIDPAFPDSGAASCVTMKADGTEEPVRALDAFKTAILPETYPVNVNAYGIDVPGEVKAGVRRFALNRLELDDVEVSAPGGGTTKVAGTARVDVKNASGGWSSLSCANALATHTGLDLPNGTYRITSTAKGASGTVSHTEEISFP